ncbi:MAG: helix-turn-helix domain-containing protein [Cellulosilyticaceae bacterium]
MKELFMRNIGDTIKLLREERNMTQQDLAKALHQSRSSISMYESNVRIPSDDIKEAICDYFNVDMNFLFGKTSIRNSFRESNKENNTDEITNINDAMLFLLSNPVVSAYGGYDFDRMSDEEKIQFANKMMGVLKMVADDYK